MISGLTIAENAYLPLRDVVFQTLRQAILKGELQPGERLMEIKLAETLGVSRTPIREAIRKLELEGLVVMIPRKGAAVANITEKDTKDVLEVRRTLEMFAVEVACDRITEEQLIQLKEAAKAFEASKGSMDNFICPRLPSCSESLITVIVPSSLCFIACKYKGSNVGKFH